MSKNTYSVQALIWSDGSVQIPSRRGLSEALGQEVPVRGIRITSEATGWIDAIENLVGVVWASGDTDGRAMEAGDMSGMLEELDAVRTNVESLFWVRNGAKQASDDPTRVLPPEIAPVAEGVVPGRTTEDSPLTQEESRLLISYRDDIRRPIRRRPLSIAEGEAGMLHVDGYDFETDTVIEAKARADRNSVRMAIGQLLDYRRRIPEVRRSMILLPGWPAEDLIELAHSVDMVVCARQSDGTFAVR